MQESRRLTVDALKGLQMENTRTNSGTLALSVIGMAESDARREVPGSGGHVPGGALHGGALPGGAVPGGAVPGGALHGGALHGGAVPGGAILGRALPAHQCCAVCDEEASGMYFGALVCLPCKSFFIRSTKDGDPRFSCLGNGVCNIIHGNRLRCQHCRFQKCLRAGMCRKEKPEIVEPAEGQVLCRVCQDIANGVHFGVPTCEGCKKFFRRALKESSTYFCKFEKMCAMNPRSRNTCRFCRYRKCIHVGMSRNAIRMGRPKKLSKSDLQKLYSAGSKGVDLYASKGPCFGGPSGFRPHPRSCTERPQVEPNGQVASDRFENRSMYSSRSNILESSVLNLTSHPHGRFSARGSAERYSFFQRDDHPNDPKPFDNDCSSSGSAVGSPQSSTTISYSSAESNDGQDSLIDIEDDLTNILHNLNYCQPDYSYPTNNVLPRIASNPAPALHHDVIKIEGGAPRNQCQFANDGYVNCSHNYNVPNFSMKQETDMNEYEDSEHSQMSPTQGQSHSRERFSSNLYSLMYNSLC